MASLVRKTGTISNSTTINTGLSSITHFVFYRQSMGNTGLIIGNYNKELGMSYTYKNMLGILKGTETPTVNGGTITWAGTIGTDVFAPAKDETYTWIAYGE